MSEPVLPPTNSAAPGPALRTRRCVRHTEREAAARCPGCGGFFCRECVSEHGGRALCVDCLAKAAPTRAVTRRRWPALRRGATLAGAIGLAWLSFYAVGLLLLKIPASFHEETVWNATTDEDP